jgi:hypothetical protein
MYVGLAWHFWNTRWRGSRREARPARLGARRRSSRRSRCTAGCSTTGIFARELRFGFAQALSVMMFLGVALYWIESLYYDVEGMQPLVLPLAAVAVPLPALFPGLASAGAHASATAFKLHLALAMIAYSLFIIALLHAALMAVVERRLHQKGSFFAGLPPLLTLEQLLFRVIGAAFVFLTLTLITGSRSQRRSSAARCAPTIRRCSRCCPGSPSGCCSPGASSTAGAAAPRCAGRCRAS